MSTIETELKNRIEAVLDEKVRPVLLDHGGDVVAKELYNDVLRIELLGACASCPSAYLTTEQLIQEEITSVIPEISRVVLIQSVSEDLLEQARKILGKS